MPISPISTPQLLLGPGELVKSSGKFPAPTKIPGKNYCKDEVVIRNSDSGKVSPGAKERLVQITGPEEDKINYAKQLMDETIRRNASPVRSELPDKERLGSNSSLNSSTSDDSLRYQNPGSKRATLLHSFSTNDASLGEYKYTVTVGEESIKITGTNLDLVKAAKLILDEYFAPNNNDQYGEHGFDEEVESFETPVMKRVNSQESEESDETYKVAGTGVPVNTPLVKSSSLKLKINTPAPIEDIFTNIDNNLTPEEIALNNEIMEEKKKAKKLSSQQTTPPIQTAPLTYKVISYSNEELIGLSNSSLSRKPVNDWARICKDVPSIVKKAPFDWFDPKIYNQKRPQECDAINAIQNVDSSSPDVEQ